VLAALIGLGVRTDDVSNVWDRQPLTVDIGAKTFKNVVKKGVLIGLIECGNGFSKW